MNRKYLAAAGAAGLVIALFAVWFLIFRDSAPGAVSLDDAVGSVTTVAGGSTPATTTPAGSLDGTWTIDTGIGGGVVENSSFVGYRVQEELANIGAKTAVGRTTGLSGTFGFAGSALESANIVADMTGLTSESRGRDGQMRSQALQTNAFPEATFALTAPVDLEPVDGQSFSVEATGDLTIHGVTQSVTVTIAGQLTGTTVVVVGRVPITFADYGMDRPSTAVVLSVDDRGEMEFQLFLTRS